MKRKKQVVNPLASVEFEEAKQMAYHYLLTAPQAAKVLGVTRQRVYQMIDEGKLNAGNAFNQMMITTSSVTAHKVTHKSHKSEK